MLSANGGGWALDSTLTVVNTATDSVSKKIRVGYNPKKMVLDADNRIWVLCYGYIEYNTDWSIAKEYPSKLVVLASSDFSVQKEIAIGLSKHPEHLGISPDRKTVYVGGGFGFSGIYGIATSATSFPMSPIISGNFYGFGINPGTGEIYTCIAPNFVGPGKVSAWTTTGVLKKEFQTGIAPNGILF
jgi:DNA-binding beta-propeller fold protein YncE